MNKKCIDNNRHRYRKNGICYGCSKTKEENGTIQGGRRIISERNQTGYEVNKRWRIKNPKIRKMGTDRYYKKNKKWDIYSREKYSYEDEILIWSKIYEGKVILDIEIAKKLGRSLKAIQTKRVKLNKLYSI